MNFEKLLNVADSNRVAAQSEASVKRYSTILAPPKKPPKSSVQSSAVKRFLAKRDEEERLKALEERKKKQELLCLRSQNSKNSKKAKIMASRTKDNDFSRIRMTDDEVVAKNEREAKLLRMSLNSKMDRMKARIELEEKEKLLPHKRKRKPKIGDSQDIEINENHIYSENRKQNNCTLNLQAETNSRLSSKEINKRMRSKVPSGSAPPVNFNDLLKIAATKQYQPVELPEVEISDTEDRPLSKRERSQLLAEKVRLKKKLSNGEQNLAINRSDISHGKSKPIALNNNHIQHINKTQGVSQELLKSNVNLRGIGDREKIIPCVSNSHVSKRYPSTSEAMKSFIANKGSRNIISKSDVTKVSLNQQANIKANIHKNNLGRNSLEYELQNHQVLPSKQKVINKSSEKYVGVQNGHKIPSTDAVKRKQSTANNSAQRKVPHSNPQQNAILAKSVPMGNISEGGKSTFPTSRNTFNNSKGKNISFSNCQSLKTTSHPKTLSEHRRNGDTIENIKKFSAKGADLTKSSSCGYRLSSNDLFSDKGSKLSKSSAISSSREFHSSAVHKNQVISSKVPGKTNIRSVVGNNSRRPDSGQYPTTNDLRIKNNGKPLFQSQERVQNVKRVPENLLPKTKSHVLKSSLQDHNAPVSKFNAKSEIVKKSPLSTTKMPSTKQNISSEYPPTRPPSSLKSSAVRSLSAALPTARPIASSNKPSPPKPPIKSSYPRNPYLDPPRRLLESHRPQRRPVKRKIESDEDDEDDDMSDFIDDGPTDDPADVSKYIKEIFNYDRSRYIDDDDDDVMETTFAEQMKEEFRSAKLGLLEDLEDMRKEEEEKKRKKKKVKK